MKTERSTQKFKSDNEGIAAEQIYFDSGVSML